MGKEIWKPIKNYRGYLISSHGRVKSLSRKNLAGAFRKERIRKPVKVLGYLYVGLWRNGKQKLFRVHRLVGTFFIPNKNKLSDINHIDGNKTNNKVENLEWTTSGDNQKHARRLGLMRNDYCAKLNWRVVKKIRMSEDSPKNRRKLSKKYSVHEATIRRVQKGYSWNEPI